MKLFSTIAAFCITVIALTQQAVAVAEKDFVWYCESDEATEAQKATVSEIYNSFGIDQKKVGCKEALLKMNEGYDTYLNFIDASPLTDLSPIAGLKEIQILECNVCGQRAFDTIPEMLNLTHLSMTSSSLTSISKLKRFPKLQQLNIANNPVIDISGLEEAHELTELNLSDTRVTDTSILAKTSKLQTLFLNETSAEAVKTLPYMESLKKLHLEKIVLKKTPDFKKTPNLTHLYFQLNELDNVDGISALKHLTDLHLSLNAITHIDASELPNSLEELNVLGLSLDNYTFLHNLTLLKRLGLRYAETVKWQDIDHLLPSIVDLNLRDSNLAQKEIPEGKTEKWQNIEYLDLSNSQVSSLEFFNRVAAPNLEVFVPPSIPEKTEENCPTSGVPVPVAKFCKEK